MDEKGHKTEYNPEFAEGGWGPPRPESFLLQPGFRQGIRDPLTPIESRDHLMRILQLNLAHRQKNRGKKSKKSRRDRLQGLFGSRD